MRLREAECSDAQDKAEVRRRETLRLTGEIATASDPAQRLALAARMRSALATLTGGSKAKWRGDGLAVVQEACKRLRAMLDAVPGGEFGREVGEIDRAALTQARVLVRLYRKLGEAYAAQKAAGGCLDFEDLLIRAHALLATNDAVRRRVKEKIRYLLVDELQDSALIDREILMLLVRDEADVTESSPRVTAGRLFVVGDDKQSIYRFRGAEVTVFREFAELLETQGEVVDLDVNFRTVPSGVAFANDFFGRLLGRREPRHAYENRYLALTPRRREDTPFLEVLLPEPDEEEKTLESARRGWSPRASARWWTTARSSRGTPTRRRSGPWPSATSRCSSAR